MLQVQFSARALNQCLASWRRACDLRFPDARDEAAFRRSLEPRLLRTWLVGSLVSLVLHCIKILGFYKVQMDRKDTAPFVWDAGDPRTLFFSMRMGRAAISGLIALMISIRLGSGRLSCVHWEFLFMVSLFIYNNTLYMMSTWSAAVMYDAEPLEVWGSDTSNFPLIALCYSMALTAGVCHFVPLRTCVLWVAPASAILAYLVMLLSIGTPRPSAMGEGLLLLLLTCISCLGGAFQRERQLRETWLVLRRLKEQDIKLEDAGRVTCAFQAMVGTLCDIVVMLSSDLKVMDSDTTHDSFFGQPMSQRCLSEILEESNRSRFESVLQQASASKSRQSMPATLCLPHAQVEVQMVVVSTCCAEPRYIIGLHSVQQTQTQEQTVVRSVANTADAEEEEADSTSCYQEAQSSLWVGSRPTTTQSDRVFADLYQRKGEEAAGVETVRPQLEEIAEIGSREHWLVGTQEVELFPDRVLGKGGFGQVVLGKMRGHTVAVKLPMILRGTVTLRNLVSMVNELRVCRRIRHPNIVGFFGACIDTSAGAVGLLYECVQGADLHTFVTSKLDEVERPPLAQQKFIVEVACALRYLHGMVPQIVHGDLKPKNIMVETVSMQLLPRAKLLDFGLSRLLTRSSARPLGGTASWRAPELCVQPNPSPQSTADVFSFGLVMHFVLARAPLPRWGRVSWPAHVSNALSLWPAAVGDYGYLEGWSRLCADCLKFEPDLREQMENIHNNMLQHLPCDSQAIALFGTDIALMRMEGTPWRQGVSKLQSAWLETEALQQPEQRGDDLGDQVHDAACEGRPGLCRL